MVELSGIEPLTSSLQMRRSSQLNYSPLDIHSIEEGETSFRILLLRSYFRPQFQLRTFYYILKNCF